MRPQISTGPRINLDTTENLLRVIAVVHVIVQYSQSIDKRQFTSPPFTSNIGTIDEQKKTCIGNRTCGYLEIEGQMAESLLLPALSPPCGQADPPHPHEARAPRDPSEPNA
jgi:hypothetical protein